MSGPALAVTCPDCGQGAADVVEVRATGDLVLGFDCGTTLLAAPGTRGHAKLLGWLQGLADAGAQGAGSGRR